MPGWELPLLTKKNFLFNAPAAAMLSKSWDFWDIRDQHFFQHASMRISVISSWLAHSLFGSEEEEEAGLRARVCLVHDDACMLYPTSRQKVELGCKS